MPEKIAEELPKALFGLLIPLLQFAWKRYAFGRVQTKKALLRQTLADLSNQRKALSSLTDLPDCQRALEDVDCEISEKLAELANLSNASLSARRPAEHSAIDRWLLLYMPSGITAWILHSLYFLSVGLVVVTVAYTIKEDDYFNGWIFLCAASLLLAVLFRNAAAWVDRGRFWVAAVMFWTAFVCGLFAWIVSIPTSPSEWAKVASDFTTFVLPTTAIAAVAAAVAFKVAHSQCTSTAGLLFRERLLVFRPTNPVGWFAILSFYLGIVGIAFSAADVFHNAAMLKSAVWDASSLFEVLFILGHTICSWRWAQSMRRKRSSLTRKARRPATAS